MGIRTLVLLLCMLLGCTSWFAVAIQPGEFPSCCRPLSYTVAPVDGILPPVNFTDMREAVDGLQTAIEKLNAQLTSNGYDLVRPYAEYALDPSALLPRTNYAAATSLMASQATVSFVLGMPSVWYDIHTAYPRNVQSFLNSTSVCVDFPCVCVYVSVGRICVRRSVCVCVHELLCMDVCRNIRM
jgi:hypothetical protein